MHHDRGQSTWVSIGDLEYGKHHHTDGNDKISISIGQYTLDVHVTEALDVHHDLIVVVLLLRLLLQHGYKLVVKVLL